MRDGLEELGRNLHFGSNAHDATRHSRGWRRPRPTFAGWSSSSSSSFRAADNGNSQVEERKKKGLKDRFVPALGPFRGHFRSPVLRNHGFSLRSSSDVDRARAGADDDVDDFIGPER